MRLIIIGDSLPIYVYHPSREYLYGFILKKYFESKGNNEVYIIAKPRNNTRIQSRPSRLLYDIKQFEPNIVIIHLGITDCAPRLFSLIESFYLQSLPNFFRRQVIKFLSTHRYFLTKKFPKVYVNLNDFKIFYQKILTKVIGIGGIPIIINIAKPSNNLIKKSFNFLENVKQYNKILSNLAKSNRCQFVDLYSIIENDSQFRWDDGYHLAISGHRRLAEILIHLIELENNLHLEKNS